MRKSFRPAPLDRRHPAGSSPSDFHGSVGIPARLLLENPNSDPVDKHIPAVYLHKMHAQWRFWQDIPAAAGAANVYFGDPWMLYPPTWLQFFRAVPQRQLLYK